MLIFINIIIYHYNGFQYGNTINPPISFLNFGYSVSLSDNGSRLIVCDNDVINVSGEQGKITVYEYNEITAMWDILGSPIINNQIASISNDGKFIIVGNFFYDNFTGRSIVYKYNINTNNWEQFGNSLIGTANSRYGESVFITNITNTEYIIAVASFITNITTIYNYSTSWVQLGQTLEGSVQFLYNYNILVQDLNFSNIKYKLYNYDKSIKIWRQKGNDLDKRFEGFISLDRYGSISNDNIISILSGDNVVEVYKN